MENKTKPFSVSTISWVSGQSGHLSSVKCNSQVAICRYLFLKMCQWAVLLCKSSANLHLNPQPALTFPAWQDQLSLVKIQSHFQALARVIRLHCLKQSNAETLSWKNFHIPHGCDSPAVVWKSKGKRSCIDECIKLHPELLSSDKQHIAAGWKVLTWLRGVFVCPCPTYTQCSVWGAVSTDKNALLGQAVQIMDRCLDGLSPQPPASIVAVPCLALHGNDSHWVKTFVSKLR